MFSPMLLVSTDKGETWKSVATTPPEGGSIVFRTPKDGVYYFTVQAVGPDGKLEASKPTGEQITSVEIAVHIGIRVGLVAGDVRIDRSAGHAQDDVEAAGVAAQGAGGVRWWRRRVGVAIAPPDFPFEIGIRVGGMFRLLVGHVPSGFLRPAFSIQ
jgi:hypothetical protein